MTQKYGMAELLEFQARKFVEEKLKDFDDLAKKQYLKAVCDSIYQNYPSAKDAD